MSKLACPCDYTIADQTLNLPYKAHLLPNTELDNFFNLLTESIDSLSNDTKSNQRTEWIKKHFNVPPYPLDIKDSSMIFDILTTAFFDKSKLIYECENCGRIAIQRGKTEQFQFFSPDTKNTKGILDKK